MRRQARSIASLLGLICFLLVGGRARAQYYYPPPPPYYYPPPPPPNGYYYPPVPPRPKPNPYERAHFYMGIAGEGVFALGQSSPRSLLSDGGGYDIFIGGRFSPFFAFELGWQSTFHDSQYNYFAYYPSSGTLTLNASTFDTKWFFASGWLQPYLRVGGGIYFLGDYYTLISEGPGFQAGVGADVWLSAWCSLGGSIEYRGVGLFDYSVYGNDVYLSLLVGKVDFTGHF